MTFDPHHNPCQRIEDMLLAIASIRESVTGVTYEQFLANREKRQSVAYDIEIIGEAANAIDRSVQEKYPTIPWSDFIGMRNVLIHDYSDIDFDIAWRVVSHDIDELALQIKPIYEALPPVEPLPDIVDML